MSKFSKTSHLESIEKFKYVQSQNSIIIHTTTSTETNTTLEIIIILDNNFPSSKPYITIPNYDHELIKSGIVQFDYDKLLGDSIDDLLAIFQVSPPVWIKLDKLPHTRVTELLNDNEQFTAYIHSIDKVVGARNVHESVLMKNAEIAEKNLNRSLEIKELKARIEQLQLINQQHRSTLDSLLYQQEQELVRFGSEYVTEQLRQMVATSDDMSELCATSFLEGKLTEEEFLKAFKESRKLYHLRNAKLERSFQV